MSQLRLNPLSGRWVTIVAERAERPVDFAPRSRVVEADPTRACPFCPGNEEATPPALETYDREGRWCVRVVPNIFPAFAGADVLSVTHLGPVFTQAPASGIHEVLVLSPRHDGSLPDMDDANITLLMTALRDRLRQHSLQPGVRYTQAIVNHGREAGASLMHPHGQLLGMPFVPGTILEEEAGFSRFEGSCLLCTVAEAEMSEETRVVLSNDRVVAVSPFWAGTPYELLVIPTTHHGHLETAQDDDLVAVGQALRDTLGMARATLGDLAYNVVFHTAPYRHDGLFHWHAHVWPKLVSIAGFERGTGVMINIIPPEFAAAELRRSLVR